MLYASDLTKIRGAFDAQLHEDIDDIPDLIAHLLADSVEHRLRRNFTRGYRHRERALTRVRGRVDILTTETRQLLSRGEVFCRYEELTVDTPRNRLVRAALERMARLVARNDLVRQCRALAATLARAGVSGTPPPRVEVVADQMGRNDASDRSMVALAHLAFDLALPTEVGGSTPLAAPEREEAWVRRLFERAVLGFARVEFQPLGWSIRGGTLLDWQVSSISGELAEMLPRMVTDIMLYASNTDRRLVIDTKFTSITRTGRFGNTTLNSNYLYQMYAYLRSQEGNGRGWETAAGLFLHPAIGKLLHERVVIQGHSITFATVDLDATPTDIRNDLRHILRAACQGAPGAVGVSSETPQRCHATREAGRKEANL